MRRNIHFVVPKTALRLVEHGAYGKGGANALAEYRWGSGTARHLFCATCGVCPFYQPRSNPDGWAVTFQCVDGGTVSSVEVRRFDGLNWEAYYAGQGAAIKEFSKAAEEAAGAGAANTRAASARPSTRAQWEPSSATHWVLALLEVLATLLLPIALILLTTRNYVRRPPFRQMTLRLLW